MKYSSRFWLYGPLVLFFALAAWAMGHWWIRASELDKTLKAMNGHQAIPGVVVSWANHTISGFPFQLDVVFNDFLVRAEAPRGSVVWHSERFALHALTYGRTHDIFEAAGAQALAWTDADGIRHRLSFIPATLRASAIADTRGLSRFDLDMVDAGGKDSDGKPFTAARVQLHIRRDPKGDALDLALSAEQVKDAASPFGDHIQNLALYSRITQGSAFGRLLAGRSGWMDALMAWRHRKGAIVNGPLHIQSSGITADQMEAKLEPRLRALLFPFY
jgi:hypothetical protein